MEGCGSQSACRCNLTLVSAVAAVARVESFHSLSSRIPAILFRVNGNLMRYMAWTSPGFPRRTSLRLRYGIFSEAGVNTWKLGTKSRSSADLGIEMVRIDVALNFACTTAV